MKKLLLSVLSALLLFSVFGCNNGKETASSAEPSISIGPAAEINNKIETTAENSLESQHFSGYVLVSKDGKTIIDKGYGFADYEKKILNTVNTRFRIGSISKQFTAMGIMMLEERGLLSTADTLKKYIPDYPQGDEITIHQLLTHTSGIFNYTELNPKNIEIKESYSPEDIISAFKNHTPNFQPGLRFDYSNSNYVLLGYIIEKVSGLTYEDFMEKNIFKPLGMKNTGCDKGIGNINNIAVGYSRAESPDIENPVAVKDNLLYKVAYSAGEIYSTAEDLLKWDKALYTESLVKNATLNKIFTSYVESPYQNSYGYGYGWFIKGSNPHLVCHSGSVTGFISEFYRDFDNKSVIIILSNNETDVSAISEYISDTLNTGE